MTGSEHDRRKYEDIRRRKVIYDEGEERISRIYHTSSPPPSQSLAGPIHPPIFRCRSPRRRRWSPRRRRRWCPRRRRRSTTISRRGRRQGKREGGGLRFQKCSSGGGPYVSTTAPNMAPRRILGGPEMAPRSKRAHLASLRRVRFFRRGPSRSIFGSSYETYTHEGEKCTGNGRPSDGDAQDAPNMDPRRPQRRQDGPRRGPVARM